MSPSGKARPNQGAGDNSSLASAHLEGGDRPASLPLRLSVARGGLGLELAAPVEAGPLLVDELEVELPGLNYPLDLSKGVKQFRNRRSVLRHASLRLNTTALAKIWGDELEKLWGAGVRVKLRPVYDAGSPETTKGTGDSRDNDPAAGIPSLAVTIHRAREALAFDLVVLSGTSPRIAIDGARAIGRKESPLFLAMQALDAGLGVGGAAGAGVSLHRTGRAIQMSGLAEAVALLVLPTLGCRLPQVHEQVITKVQHDAGEIRLELGHRGEPFSAGRRGLWVAGVADFLLAGDEALGAGETARARENCLEALERAPGHPEALLLLAEIDLAAGDRGEAALSFLQELEGLEGTRFAYHSGGRRSLALARALKATDRLELVQETQLRALAEEGDAVMHALIGLEVAEKESESRKKRSRLDAALARAPFLSELRWARFELALQMGDFPTATSDAEQLEAAESSSIVRATICHKVGVSFSSVARPADAFKWLRRALRLSPDDPKVMLRLAECLIDSGETLRAAELLQSSVRRMAAESPIGEGADASDAKNPEQPEMVREMLSEARFVLGRLFLREQGDIPSALSQLNAVETRTRVGAEARLVEAEIHHRREHYSARDRVLYRLLEAAEMSWIDLAPHASALTSLLENWGSSVEPAVLEFAERILAQTKEHGVSRERKK